LPNRRIIQSKKSREPSYRQSTYNSAAKKVNQSFDNRRDTSKEYSDDPTLNSKYRLISLEKKFENQKIKAKDKIEYVSKKMEYL
jgi:hypothetical protein